jgi:hypothetical protein
MSIPPINSSSNISQTPKPNNINHNNKTSQWGSELQVPINSQLQPSSKTMTVSFERAPQNLTNQNATLTPEQMAKFLSQQLAKKESYDKTSRIGAKNPRINLEADLTSILEQNSDLNALLNASSPEAIAEFLKFFQSEISRHLKGVELGNVVYDEELLNHFRGFF